VAKGEVQHDKFLLINSSNEAVPFAGENTTEPAFGLPARWIKQSDKEIAVSQGFVVVDPATVIATHVTEVIKSNAYEIMGRDELQKLLDLFKQSYPKVVEDLIPNLLPIGTVLKVCKNLLKEGISIKDMRTILETLADYAPMTKEAEYLTEFVRQQLGAQISSKLKADDGNLYVLTLDPATEMKIKDSFKDGGIVSPSFVKKFLSSIDKNSEHFMMTGTNPVILTGPDTRRFVKRLIEKSLPNVSVISTAEVGGIKLQTLGVVGD
jgi:flagellar biosynthesis protein FlhA